jgi:hypothetical protein
MTWISVKERLPEDRYLVIAFRPDDWVFPGFMKYDIWYNAIDDLMEDHVTHWQPLPAPPEGKE